MGLGDEEHQLPKVQNLLRMTSVISAMKDTPVDWFVIMSGLSNWFITGLFGIIASQK